MTIPFCRPLASSLSSLRAFGAALVGLFALTLVLSGCNSSSGSGSTPTPTQYTVGGTVTGYNSTGLVLQNNSGDDLTVSGNSFTFATALDDGSSYSVSVLTQPAGQSCSVSNGSGTLSGANVNIVAISCVSQYTVGGTVTGLTATGLVLQNNGGDDLAVAGTSFEFATALDDGSSYNVTVLTDPTGQYCSVGNGSGTLSGAAVTSVAVGCKGWGTAALIESDDAGSANNPQIAFDSSGNAIAVWYQYDGTRNNIWANRYTSGSGWGTAGLIETDNAGPASNVKISFDGSGNAIAVWEQVDGTRSNIWANRYTAGSGWGTAALIESDDAGSANKPQIAIDGSGNAIAVWQQNDGTRYNIVANRYTAGSGWGTTGLIETDNASYAYNPQIAFDGSGNAIAVWQQHDGTRTNIWANRYTAGSGWGTAGLIETDNASYATNPQIAFDGSGNAIAVWEQSDGTRYNIVANRYTAGSGWGTAALIESDDAGSANNPQIAFDSSGNAIAVWNQSDGTRYNIWANRYTSGSGWGTAGLIETDNAGPASNVKISFDGSGNAIAVWNQSDGTRYNIVANRYTAGSGWETAGLIETDNAGDALSPQIAFDGSGNAIAVWNQSDGTRNNIWANRYE